MFLSRIQIWNFRKISTSNDNKEILPDNPGLDLVLNPTMNVIVGENDSGKTAIVDAIRLVLGTQSMEYQRLEERDFNTKNGIRSNELRIECVFSDFTPHEAGQFLEWIHFNNKGNYELRVWLYANLKDNRVISYTRAGIDEEGSFIDSGAKDLLRITYLKPLRDAEAELSPGYKSRLAQILSHEPLFKDEYNAGHNRKDHALEKYIAKANSLIKAYFSEDILEENTELSIVANTPGGSRIKKKIKDSLDEFFHSEEPKNPEFQISGSNLSSILRKLSLELEDNKSGLGALNQLFIAVELLLLQGESYNGLKLVLIEELEAHLHPQAQLRVISALQEKLKYIESQFILTTHSTTLASKIQLDNLIVCHDGKAFSLKKGFTGLEEDDYEFLERFLDATKANLFFAKGVIIVEGDAENILIPTIAELIDRPLHKYGVSIVNVGSKALLRYVKIFNRMSNETLPIKVAVITDLDIEQEKNEDNKISFKTRGKEEEVPDIDREVSNLRKEYNSANGYIKVFHSPLWTMEYDIAMGELVEFINKAIHIAQLSQSRIKRKDFSGLSEKDVETRKKEADDLFKQWKEKKYDERLIAFEIYSKLKKNMASKTVSAQWLSKILVEEKKEEISKILKRDTNIRYIVDAIYHVTKTNDQDN